MMIERFRVICYVLSITINSIIPAELFHYNLLFVWSLDGQVAKYIIQSYSILQPLYLGGYDWCFLYSDYVHAELTLQKTSPTLNILLNSFRWLLAGKTFACLRIVWAGCDWSLIQSTVCASQRFLCQRSEGRWRRWPWVEARLGLRWKLSDRQENRSLMETLT